MSGSLLPKGFVAVNGVEQWSGNVGSIEYGERVSNQASALSSNDSRQVDEYGRETYIEGSLWLISKVERRVSVGWSCIVRTMDNGQAFAPHSF